jgi:glycosyltransferase involved in cell wall biosynthesis
MIAFQQERLIAQAIESVLMQRTRFPFELVVSEDCSTDGTRCVISSYEQRYPGQVRLLAPHPRGNLGIVPNWIRAYAACRGEYTAALEGDDYWTDATKLQTQVDAMDAHQSWALCHHCVRYVHGDTSEALTLFPPEEHRGLSGFRQLLQTNFIQTCAVMFRRRLVLRLPDKMARLSLGDWPTCLLYAQHGDIGYIDRVMSNYRVHAGGTWSQSSMAKRTWRLAEMFGTVRECVGRENQRAVARRAYHAYIDAAKTAYRAGDLVSAVWGAVEAVKLVGLSDRGVTQHISARLGGLLRAITRRAAKSVGCP